MNQEMTNTEFRRTLVFANARVRKLRNSTKAELANKISHTLHGFVQGWDYEGHTKNDLIRLLISLEYNLEISRNVRI